MLRRVIFVTQVNFATLSQDARRTSEMVKSCCAVGCANRLTKGSALSFYRFPTDSDRRSRWIAAINRKDWCPTEYSYVCSAHFVSGKKSNDQLSPDYVPSIFRHVRSPIKRKRRSDFQVYRRRKKALRTRLENALREETARRAKEAAREEAARALEQLKPCEAGVQTQLSLEDIDYMEERSCEVRVVHENVLTQDFLKSDSAKASDAVKFYTGLPSYARFMAVFNFVSAPLNEHQNSTLSLFQQFLMTMIKLRLNLSDQDIAYRFGVSQPTVSKTFRKWINLMYIRLKPIIKWPSHEEVVKTMPSVFVRGFKRCICIIDCFEVFCERPSDLMARAQTYSQYKHHNTVKFLIAATPQGVVSFVSKGWGGRVSDKHLTENCGLLSHLQPGDQILADRGFTVQDSVGLYCAEVIVPPFTKGKKQLSRLENDTARQLSRLRIHIERVIGVIRQKYTILESTLSINMIMCDDETDISVVDKIVVVCCALCNVCDSVVPF